MITPRNLVSLTSSIGFPLINILFFRLIYFPFGEKSIQFVLPICSDNLLAFSHVYMRLSSLLIVVMRVSKSEFEAKRLVSSANSIVRKDWETLARSFMYIRNNNGPSIDPCGTPQDIYIYISFIDH